MKTMYDFNLTNSNSDVFRLPPGEGTLQVNGTLDGATVTLKASLAETGDGTVSGGFDALGGQTTISASSDSRFGNWSMNTSADYRVDLSGEGASTDVNVFVRLLKREF